jgi:hypothetical protein
MRSQFYSTDLKRTKRLEENPDKLRDGLDAKKTFSTGRGGYYFFLAFLEPTGRGGYYFFLAFLEQTNKVTFSADI